jgi:hypothetical protein
VTADRGGAGAKPGPYDDEPEDTDELRQRLLVQIAQLEEQVAVLERIERHENYDKEAENETVEFVDTINRLGEVFDRLCIERHQMGQEEYGKFTFLGNDVVRMMIEELADTANYCRYQAVKLLLLQEALSAQLASSGLSDEKEEITIGIGAFKGVKDVGWGSKQ